MRSPSIKALVDTFRITEDEAKLVKQLCSLADDRDALEALIAEKCPATDAYARSCYNSPWTSGMWRRTMILHAIDKIVDTCGVEPLGPMNDHRVGYAPPYEYLNTGDSYAATLIYKRATDNLFIGDWGSIAEKHANW